MGKLKVGGVSPHAVDGRSHSVFLLVGTDIIRRQIGKRFCVLNAGDAAERIVGGEQQCESFTRSEIDETVVFQPHRQTSHNFVEEILLGWHIGQTPLGIRALDGKVIQAGIIAFRGEALVETVASQAIGSSSCFLNTTWRARRP